MGLFLLITKYGHMTKEVNAETHFHFLSALEQALTVGKISKHGFIVGVHYMAICNRIKWAKYFKVYRDSTMQLLSSGRYLYKARNELLDAGFLDNICISSNQHTATTVSLKIPDWYDRSFNIIGHEIQEDKKPKGVKSPEKPKKDDDPELQKDIETFEKAWKAYCLSADGKKSARGVKRKALSLFKGLSAQKRQDVFHGMRCIIKERHDSTYRPYLDKFIRDKMYEDYVGIDESQFSSDYKPNNGMIDKQKEEEIKEKLRRGEL